ncbi:MAG: class beta-lactamase-related serine hydrolase [Marmoricola sp.]|nr:class beta-lactamase-related serine hydrolase [Marmoricola sp.]
MPTQTFTSLAAQLDQWERERDLSGAFLLTRGGETVFEHANGYADRATGSRATPATRFALASLTKMFTAVAVADLVSAGSLSFHSQVVEVLPVDRRPSTLLSEVTIHHLLSHQSGIADYAEEDEDSPFHVEDYGSLWVDRPSYAMQRPLDFLPLFGDRAPYRPPGEQYQYSNAGYVLLGLVIEEVTGQPFIDVVQERVYDRAGMETSGFFRLDEAVPDLAIGYLPRTGPDAPWRTNVFSVPVVGGADGGAHSTVRDIDRFLHAYADGTLLGEHLDRFLVPHSDAGEGYFEGYGVHLYPDGRYGHGGWDPGVMVLANRWPDDDVNVVVLCNGEGLAGEVRDLVVEAWRGSAG